MGFCDGTEIVDEKKFQFANFHSPYKLFVRADIEYIYLAFCLLYRKVSRSEIHVELDRSCSAITGNPNP